MPQAAFFLFRQFWQHPPRKFFSHFVFYFLALITHQPVAALSIEITLSLTLPLVQSILLNFQKAKPDKTVSGNNTQGVSLNFLPSLILLAPY